MRLIVRATAAAVALACTVASAAGAVPKGGYSVFAQCPTDAYQVNGCIYATIEGGYIAIGRTIVPIAKAQTLQGGLLRPKEEGVKHLVSAVDGETLTKVGQTVPGGLGGSPVSAVPELAAPASSVVLDNAAALSLVLPVKIRLENSLLGAECSIGSNWNPIELHLTTGATNGGLTGDPGKEASIEEGGILVKSGVRLVAGGFTVPRAGGCGSALLNDVVDADLGVPSSRNTIVFDAKVEIANSELVEEAER